MHFKLFVMMFTIRSIIAHFCRRIQCNCFLWRDNSVERDGTQSAQSSCHLDQF